MRSYVVAYRRPYDVTLQSYRCTQGTACGNNDKKFLSYSVPYLPEEDSDHSPGAQQQNCDVASRQPQQRH